MAPSHQFVHAAKRRRCLTADWTKFGLTRFDCDTGRLRRAGGRFFPVIFGWMVHVYPYENIGDKIFAMHHHD